MPDVLGAPAVSKRDWRDWRVWLVPVGLPLLYLALAVALTWPAARTFQTRIAGDYGDAFQNLWNYWSLKESLVHFKSPFFTDHLRYPFGVTLVFQTMTWPDAVVSLPFWAVLSPLGVYNVVVLWSFVLSGLGMYALTRELTGNRAVATFAGAAFMVIPFHMSHALGHQHLIALGYLPLYLMFLYRIVTGGTLRDAALGGLCLACAALCSWYQLLYAFVWSMGVFGWAIACHRKTILSMDFLKRALTLAACFLVVCGPLLFAMWHVAQSGPVAGSHNPRRFAADAESFFFPGGRMMLSRLSHRYSHWTGNLSENGDYLGYVLMGLSCIGVWKRTLARAFLVVAFLGVILSLGPELHVGGSVSHQGNTPYAWLLKVVPGLDFSGVPVRFGLLAQGSLVVMAAMGLAAVVEGAPQRLARALPAVATLAMLVEFWPVALPTSVWRIPPPIEQWAKRADFFSVLDLTGDTHMLWNAIHHGKPCIGGYMTRLPKRLEDWWSAHPILGHMDKPLTQLTPQLEREDPNIDFDWGDDPPAPGVLADNFSIHWKGTVIAPQEGQYEFFVMADDSAALTVDGRGVIPTTLRFVESWRSGKMALTAGPHTVIVDYQEITGRASVHVEWQGPGVERKLLAPAPKEDGEPGTFHTSILDMSPTFGIPKERAQAVLRELALRYVVLNASDHKRIDLFKRAAGMRSTWSSDGIVILELPDENAAPRTEEETFP